MIHVPTPRPPMAADHLAKLLSRVARALAVCPLPPGSAVDDQLRETMLAGCWLHEELIARGAGLPDVVAVCAVVGRHCGMQRRAGRPDPWRLVREALEARSEALEARGAAL